MEEAGVQFTQIVDGQKTVLHLCPGCAEKRGFTETPFETAAGKSTGAFSVQDFLSNLASGGDEDSVDDVCAGCGITYEEFRKKGRLGCARCYQSFSKRLQDLLRQIHGNDQHGGKAPASLDKQALKGRIPLKRLRGELQKAIMNEAFEKAAQLRDEIRKRENE